MRRVRKLQLCAPEEGLLRRGAILLEDALQTASFPGEQSDRLLLIRRLNVGPISSRSSSAHLSLAIERRLLQLGVEIVDAKSAAAAAATAVCFNDQQTALLGLALRLLRGPEPTEWFWPLAVPGFQPGQALPAALRGLLSATLRTPAGVGATAIFLKALQAQSVLDPLLAALRPQNGPAILQACGWNWPAIQVDPIPLPPEWKPALNRWTSQWGLADDRSLWLAAAALAAEKPGRLAAPRELTAAALSLLQALNSRRPDATIAHAATALAEGRPSAKAETDHRPQNSAGADGLPPILAAEHTRDPDRIAVTIVPGGRAGSQAASDHGAGPPPEAHFVGEQTTLAGLFFLLPLLARLGLPGFLELRPDLVELDLPQRILQRATGRLSPPQDDPALAALGPPPALALSQVDQVPFVAPSSWPAALCRPASPSRPWQVRRLAGDASARLLLDGSGQLVLALWRRRPSPAVKRLVLPGELTLPPPPSIQAARRVLPPLPLRHLVYHRSPLPPSTDLDLLLDTWVTALRRRLRYDTGLSLGELVLRPGRLSVSPTSLEVMLDLRQVDLRIRRAGLDLDPGWLAWFGKVVRFRYD